MMRLHDSLTIVSTAGTVATVPARVYYVSTGDVQPSSDPNNVVPPALTNTLRAIVRSMPEDFDPLADGIVWQGRTYELDGDAMPRMRHGRVHHYTLTLSERTTETP